MSDFPRDTVLQPRLRRDTHARQPVLHVPHFPAIDGARGIAILSIILYHSGWSERGLFGVDAFFVISGFLITVLLIRELHETRRIALRRFYARRARRLAPPLFLTLVGTLFLVWMYGTSAELTQTADTAIFSLLQIANWHQIGADTAYWDASGAILPLGQMWSLSVTEQFYIVWPVLIALLWSISKHRLGGLLTALTATFIAGGLVAPLMAAHATADRLYLGTDTRAVAFVAGAAIAALIAWLQVRAPGWASAEAGTAAKTLITLTSVLSLVVTVAMSVVVTSYHEPWLYQGGFALVSLTVGVLVGTLCLPGNLLIGFFSWGPFRQIGRVSYSIFLVHMPVLWLVASTIPGINPLVLFFVAAPASWVVASVVHYLWAEPLRTAKWTRVGGAIAVVAASAIIVALVVALPGIRPPTTVAAPAPGAEAPSQLFAAPDAPALPSRDDGQPFTVAVIGDSVAENIYESLANYDNRGQDALRVVDVTSGGCGIMDADSARSGEGFVMDTVNQCWPWQQKLQQANTEFQPDVYILHNLWDANDQLIDGAWVGPGDARWDDQYRTQLERLVDIGSESGRAPLILLSNDRARDPAGPLSADRLERKDAISDEVIAAHPNVKRLDLRAAVCPQQQCETTFPNGDPIYRDGSHFGPAGLRAMAPWIVANMGAGTS